MMEMAVKVLFKKDVADVAKAGQVKEVADGYARNYLIPRGLAVVASPAALKQVANVHAVVARRASEEEESARALKKRLEAQPIILEAKAGATGRLYGSITTADVVDAVKRQLGADLDRRDVEITEPVRQLGSYHVTARLHKAVTASIPIEVRAVGGG
jgi:large subunit ribosomal protein L9